MLGLSADAPQGYLYVDPYLPDWLSELTLSGIEVGNACIDLKFWREGDLTCWDALMRSGKIEVKVKSWQPWSV